MDLLNNYISVRMMHEQGIHERGGYLCDSHLRGTFVRHIPVMKWVFKKKKIFESFCFVSTFCIKPFIPPLSIFCPL